jgi:hypothetical protein
MAGHLDKNFSFMNLCKRNPEVAPVLVVVGAGCAMSAWYIGRLLNNPHTVINHKGGRMPWVNQSLAKNTHLSIFSRVPDSKLQDNTNDPNDLRGKI